MADPKVIKENLYNEEMKRAIAELSTYYGTDTERLKQDIEAARQGQVGAVGDLSVFAWASGQLAVVKLIECGE